MASTIRLKAKTGVKFLLLLPFLLLWFNLAWSQCLTSFPDTQDFEVNNGGWTTGGTASDWTWGTPAKSIIKTAASGTKCWITGGLNKTSYNNSENAWVKSPCYNFTNLQYPTVGFYVYWETENGFDGTVFQYSVDNGNTWKNVGSVNDAINCFNQNWFNTSSIRYTGNSGYSNGWSGSSVSGGGNCGAAGTGSNKWVQASHTLPYLAGFANVQFRFLFGAGSFCNNYNGFAFDHFTIGNAPANFASFTYTCINSNTVSFKGTSFFCPIYTWDFGDPASGAANSATGATPSHTFSGPGQYTVKHTQSGPDNAPASATKIITILDLNTQIVSNPLCNGDQNGSATVTVTPNNIAGLNYSWNTSPPQLSSTATNVGKGTYTVTVSGGGACTSQDNITITEPDVVSSSVITNQPSCKNDDGSISLTTSGGTAPYTYTWTPATVSGSNATGLAAGGYSVVIKDNNQCTESRSFTLQAATGISITATSTAVTCNGIKNGSATVNTISGGIAPYTYSWSPSGGNGATANNLAGGDYKVTVKDQAGCMATATVTVDEPLALAGSISSTNAICTGSDGTATMFASGGTAPYKYKWTPGNAVTAGITGLAPNAYSVVVTDANNCQLSRAVTISSSVSNLQLQINKTDVKCFGENTGSATVGVLGGSAPYTYAWSPSGGNKATAASLPAGNYSVMVKDKSGCDATGSITIAAPAKLTATVSVTNSICGNNNGSAIASASGGVSPYSYLWAPGAYTTASISGLAPNNYNLTVTDNNNCKLTEVAAIKDIVSNLQLTISKVDATCFGEKTGSASVIATGGTLPYTITWSNGAIGATASNLGKGVYTVTVKDAVDCSSTADVTIDEPASLAISLNGTNALCKNGTGSIKSTVTGGTSGYQYLWTPGNAITADLMNVNAGSYQLALSDANGCKATGSYTITEPVVIAVNISVINTICGNNNGSANAVVSGGTLPYSYQWLPGNLNTAAINNVAAATYTLTVTDKNNCQQTGTADIAASTQIVLSMSHTDVKCFGDKTGTATVIVTGGLQPYAITWSNGAVGATASNLGKGTYTVSVKDAVDCSSTADVTIGEPASLAISLSGTNALCKNGTGSIKSTVTGGTSGYQYLWTPGNAITADLMNVNAGAYQLALADANGCKATGNYIITEPAALIVNLSANASACGFNNGSAAATVSGGTAPYNYLWSPGNQTTQTINNLASGSYALTVTDKNNCTVSGQVDVGSSSGLKFSKISAVDVTCFGDKTGTATVEVEGGAEPYSITWSNGANGSSVNNLGKGVYAVTVKDAAGCSSSTSVTINEPSAALVLNLTGTNAACKSGTGSIKSTVTGGTAAYQYLWTPGNAITADLMNVNPGSYQLALSDANGCKATGSYTITEPAAVAVNISVINTNCGNNNGSANAVVSGGTLPYSYQWSPGNLNTAAINNLSPATYTLTVTDKNNCQQTGTADIAASTPLLLSISHTDVTCFGDKTGTATVIVTGGLQPYTITWSNGAIGATASNLGKGVYTVSVKDAAGCSNTLDVTIIEPIVLSVSLSGTNALCKNGTGSIKSSVTGGTSAYQYLWTPGNVATPDLTNVNAGAYQLALTDANGCKAIGSYTITEPAVIAVNISVINTNCGNNNGSANAVVSGGTLPYSYQWLPGNLSTTAINNLSPATYTLTVTDKNNCQQTGTADVAASTPIVLSLSHTDVTCFGDKTGTATVIVTGGLQPYTITWSNGAIGATASNLGKGTYVVTVKDAAGCTSNADVIISEPAEIKVVLSTVDALCFKGTGTINSITTGGVLPYQYAWSPGNAATPSLSNITAGSYSLLVSDKNGCRITTAASIKEPAALSVLLKVQDAACGNANGSINAVVKGGVSPYNYLWNPGNLTTPVINNLQADKYKLSVTDKNGCPIKDSAVVNAGNLLVDATSTNLACFGDKDGSAAVKITGGTPAYIISWSNGMSTPAISNLSAGNYTVTVKDAGGCMVRNQVLITEPDSLSVSLIATPAVCNNNDGKIINTVHGGMLPYSYLWQPGNIISQNILTALPGVYAVTVTDNNGCKKVEETTVAKTNPLKIDLGKDTGVCTNTIVLSPGIFVSYVWQNNSAAPTFNVVQPGNYWVTVTDQRGCVASDTVKIVIDCNGIWFPTAFTPNNDGTNDQFGPLGNLSLISNFSMMVFNRWGEKVFETSNPSIKWNGTYKGKMLSGTYVWFARYKKQSSQLITQKGTLVLVR